MERRVEDLSTPKPIPHRSFLDLSIPLAGL
jgi:hypothetical protein